ncbi:reverse transcriptase domain-containing protein, partial [Tanacetum coccineum]
EDEGTEGPMIIEAKIGGHCIHLMYVDGGSASGILYEYCFSQLRPEIKNHLIPATTPLIGFSGEIIWPIGQIQLLVKIRDEEHSALAWMNFMVVRSPSPYNGIIGRPGVRKLQAVLSTAHGMLRIPVEGRVITLKSSKLVPLECAVVSGPDETPSATKSIVEERFKIAINPKYPEQTVMIGSTLTEEGRNKLCGLLQRNLDIFAWKPADMTGVPRYIAEHRLNIREGCSPVRQKKRGQAADRNQAIQEEVGKLVKARIMKEVHYHNWLSNPVMVKNHDDSWRMCVNFKYLNKACPKDGYPLPEIDWKVESLCGFPFKYFLDAYKGYHQIQMAKEDEEKTAFITSQGIFCYTKMPFGLRNAGATYQRLVDKAFHKQIGRNLEVYVNDLVIKSRTEDEIVKDIEETFKTLREIKMNINLKKCTFGVEEGMFLGHKVNSKGLKICPDKVDVVLSLPSQKCLKDVQKLNGKLASLNRFLAKSAEKSLPFFKTLKKCTKKSDFHWTTEAEEAFKQMKQLIAELPMLMAPMEKEELIVYLAAAKEAVSAVLMTKRESKQMPIYFVSRALRSPELNYTSIWPPISTSMIIGPSVPSSSPRGGNKISGLREKLCVILCVSTLSQDWTIRMANSFSFPEVSPFFTTLGAYIRLCYALLHHETSRILHLRKTDPASFLTFVGSENLLFVNFTFGCLHDVSKVETFSFVRDLRLPLPPRRKDVVTLTVINCHPYFVMERFDRAQGGRSSNHTLAFPVSVDLNMWHHVGMAHRFVFAAA